MLTAVEMDWIIKLQQPNPQCWRHYKAYDQLACFCALSLSHCGLFLSGWDTKRKKSLPKNLPNSGPPKTDLRVGTVLPVTQAAHHQTQQHYVSTTSKMNQISVLVLCYLLLKDTVVQYICYNLEIIPWISLSIPSLHEERNFFFFCNLTYDCQYFSRLCVFQTWDMRLDNALICKTFSTITML